MKRKTLTAIVLSLAGMFGTGCDLNSITEYDLRNPPFIMSKVHQPEREYDEEDYMPVLCGDITVWMYCGSTRMVDDEDFILNLKTSQGVDKYVFVNKETFESFKAGDRCDLTKIKYETKDPDYKK